MGSAYANFLEDERGSLTVGKLADFVVLSRDILRIAPEDIPGTVAETVVVGGEVVVGDGEAAAVGEAAAEAAGRPAGV